MYWVFINYKRDSTRIMTTPMYAVETDEHILSHLSRWTSFAIDYNDRNLYWTAKYRSGDSGPTTIKLHKLSTDIIGGDKVNKDHICIPSLRGNSYYTSATLSTQL